MWGATAHIAGRRPRTTMGWQQVGGGTRRHSLPVSFADTGSATVAVLGTGVVLLEVHLLEARVAPPIRVLLLDVEQLLVPVVAGAVVRAARLLHHTVDLLAPTNRKTGIWSPRGKGVRFCDGRNENTEIYNNKCPRLLPLILATAGCRSIRSFDDALPPALLPPGRRPDMSATFASTVFRSINSGRTFDASSSD